MVMYIVQNNSSLSTANDSTMLGVVAGQRPTSVWHRAKPTSWRAKAKGQFSTAQDYQANLSFFGSFDQQSPSPTGKQSSRDSQAKDTCNKKLKF